MVLGPLSWVEQVQQDLEKALHASMILELMKYVRSKIANHDSMGLGSVKFMPQVLECKLPEEYKSSDGPTPKTPAVAGQVVVKGDGNKAVAEARQNCTRWLL